jgi:hypothetical protein
MHVYVYRIHHTLTPSHSHSYIMAYTHTHRCIYSTSHHTLIPSKNTLKVRACTPPQPRRASPRLGFAHFFSPHAVDTQLCACCTAHRVYTAQSMMWRVMTCAATPSRGGAGRGWRISCTQSNDALCTCSVHIPHYTHHYSVYIICASPAPPRLDSDSPHASPHAQALDPAPPARPGPAQPIAFPRT